ncbi:hypothetical protein J3R82DRAFT_6363 [Butyriboletus roseoflavus]|nr:hypothetical protein J3R82DRAFT_6363 [Butyriboletus roseoflavus]
MHIVFVESRVFVSNGSLTANPSRDRLSAGDQIRITTDESENSDRHHNLSCSSFSSGFTTSQPCSLPFAKSLVLNFRTLCELQDPVHPRPSVSPSIGQSSVPKKYTEEHESVAFDDATGFGTIAITDHAQQSLGDVVFVDLPTVGSKISKGGEPSFEHSRSGLSPVGTETNSLVETIGAVESVKAASDIV